MKRYNWVKSIVFTILVLSLSIGLSEKSQAKTTYYGGMVKKNSPIYKMHIKNEFPYIYKAKFKGKNLVVYGSLGKVKNGDLVKLYAEKKTNFKLTSKTKYRSYEGMDEYGNDVIVSYSKKQFIKKYRQLKYSELNFVIVVSKGNIVELSFQS